jgi:glutaryl-CoA dehydrogenase
MTTTATKALLALPPPTGPFLESGVLPGDFYSYLELLSDRERESIGRLREFLRTEVPPIVDDYWDRAEFPFELIPGLASLGLTAWADPASKEPKPSNVMSGFTAMELAHADASIATFFGVQSGLAMGTIRELASDEQKNRWLPAMSRMEKIGAFALTEPEHGSDSVSLETTASPDGESYVISGHKKWIGNGGIADVVEIPGILVDCVVVSQPGTIGRPSARRTRRR